MADWTPGTYNWTQLPDLQDGTADRMNRTIAFAVAAPEANDLLDGVAHVDQETLDSLVSGDRRSCFDEAADDAGVSNRVRPAEVGRGSSGIGLVIEYLFDYADNAIIIVESARVVRQVYERIASATGHRPGITLGVAEQLAADDLGIRLGLSDGSEVDLIGSGDLTSRNQDRAFTGADGFWVALGDGGRTHHFHVTAYGEVHYAGSTPAIPDWPDSEPPPYPGSQ